jgi:HEAT repeat protein
MRHALLVRAIGIALPTLAGGCSSDSEFRGRNARQWQRIQDTSDTELRATAVAALGVLPLPTGRVIMLATLRLADSSDEVRHEATLVLLEVGGRTKETGRQVGDAVSSVLWRAHTARTRELAAAVLGALGPTTRHAGLALRAALEDTSAVVRTAAIAALARTSDSSVAPRLAAVALHDSAAEARAAAVEALAKLAPNWRYGRATLALALADASPIVREQAVFAIAVVRAREDQLVHDLAHALSDSVAAVRSAALQVLGTLGSRARPAESAVRFALQDTVASVRRGAQRALESMATGSPLHATR